MEYAVWIIAAIILAAAIAYAPKPPTPPPPEFEDFKVPTAQQGREIPVIFGTVTLSSPNVVWYGDIAYSAVKTKSGK